MVYMVYTYIEIYHKKSTIHAGKYTIHGSVLSHAPKIQEAIDLKPDRCEVATKHNLERLAQDGE